MKTKLHFLLLVLFIKILTPNLANAQLVYIPDPAFRAYLNQNFPTCMAGDSIDPACPDVLNTHSLVISAGSQILDLTGIDAFSNLTYLDCMMNNLTTLPNLPSSLTTLNCQNNNLTSLPVLPPNLSVLWCFGNQLTALPVLPATLTSLACSNNPLGSLPSLPPALEILECTNNQLTSLPTLPATLEYLTCTNNQLTSLPVLPSSLYRMDCSNNPLSSLPTLPAGLNTLYCINNLLTSLPSLPQNLAVLWCSDNQLSSLPLLSNTLQILKCYNNPINSLPALSPVLTELWCSNNQLSSLPSLPLTLTKLICAHNQLTTIPTLPTSLMYLTCSYNQITTLPALSDSLKNIDCDNNQLTSIPDLPSTLESLVCNNNQLTSLPELPEIFQSLVCSNNPITCLPRLTHITILDFTSTLVTCLPNYANVSICSPLLSTLPICDLFNTNGCELYWNIEGTAYFDTDSNCVFDSNENSIYNKKLNLFSNGILLEQTYTDVNGNYAFDTDTYGIYSTELDTLSPIFHLSCLPSGVYTDTITATDSLKYNRDFGLVCNGIDLAANSITSNPLRPGHVSIVNIAAGDYSNHFGAHCASGISGTVVVTITGPASYYAAAPVSPTPSQIQGDTLTFNIPDFGQISFDHGFYLSLLVDTTAMIGDQICIQVTISTSNQELDYTNNLFNHCLTVVSSFDPNDKSVYPSSTLDISGNRWLTYTIRFQNTGTAPAEHIFITDTLSTALDWSTFSLLSYSHQPLTQVYNDGLVKFSFPHINLPDSNSNEPDSHGYVQFKIRANSGLAVGSTIENTANIFFDFNAPVITNTTGNTVINCSIPPTIINASICGGDSYLLNNVQYYNSGVYTQRITTSVGCDSLIELHLSATTFNNTISVNTGTLQTSQTGTSYQWINCNTNTAISGATEQTYTPVQGGNFAVVVSDGICSDTSNCVFFSGTGIGELNAGVTLLSSINEETNSIRVTINGLSTGGNLSITDVRGKIIFSEIIPADGNKNRQLFFPAATLARGMYLIQLSGENVRITTKVVR